MKNIQLRIYKKMALSLAAILFIQAIFPVAGFALTSGPSQPEVQSFEPVGTSEMVDLFSGDFNYNIPLLEVGGYPINIAYHAGAGVEEEASWVGLGWNLNPGAINRNMRGIPDDFAGEEVKRKINIRDNYTVGLSVNPSIELVGSELAKIFGDKIPFSYGLRYNNYKGFSPTASISLGMDVGGMGASTLNMNLGVSLDEGISVKPSLSIQGTINDKEGNFRFSGGMNIATPYNTRQGMSELNYGYSFRSKQMKLAYIGGSGMFSFNTPSYITHANNNSLNTSFTFDLKLGGAIPFTNFAGSVTGSYNGMHVFDERNLKAYGYLNSHLANNRKDLLDFNREKEVPYTKDAGVLPLANITYDSYSVLGQGVGGVFRPHRNQVGYISDPVTKSHDGGVALGLDIGGPISPISFKLGTPLAVNYMQSHSRLWEDENGAISTFGFDKRPTNPLDNILYEPAYFKQIGELSSDNNLYNELKKDAVLFPDTDKNKVFDVFQASPYVDNDISIPAIMEKRTSRNQPLSALNMEEAAKGAILKKIEDYTPGINVISGKLEKTEITINERLQTLNAKSTQLHELTTMKSDGMRYVYGLPAYNISQTNATFNMARRPNEYVNQPSEIKYNINEVESNQNGIDNFSSVEEMPSFAYGYMLTSVLSPDYVDFTGDGPSDDDLGTWVKFNYTKVKNSFGQDVNYNWKFPYVDDASSRWANFNEGFKSYDFDDKGSFMSGQKEIWVTHSMESKSNIAIFHTIDRNDGFGTDAQGKRPTSVNSVVRQKALDRIEHYSKNDLLEHGVNAIPLKTVHFKYSYSLCPEVPNNIISNNGTGKLTLDSLYFTYGKSLKGQHSKYHFEYSNENPNYNRKSQDRWGNYKAEPAGVDYNPKNIAQSASLSNGDDPYAEQDKELADKYSETYNLTKINLPSGGAIEIDYESDDYAFIQDKRAGQMHKIAGLTNVKDAVGSHNLYNPSSNTHNKIITVDIDDDLFANSSNYDATFYNLYLRGIDKLYFRSLVNLKEGKHEFVPGYADIEDHGTFEDGQGNLFGFIELRGVSKDDSRNSGQLNPITKAALNFARLNMPHLVWREKDPDNRGALELMKSMASFLYTELDRTIRGINDALINERFAQTLIPEKSFVRLNNADYSKQGGGCRVKKINMTDNWADMGNGEEANYGHQYHYQKYEQTADGENKLISSGVASYEPILGNDENPFRQPIGSNEKRFLAPDNNSYIETPYGESFFPGASVGYSQVIVAATRPSGEALDGEIKKTATGYTVSKFYTARDFPYEVKMKKGTPFFNKPGPLFKFLQYKTVDEVTAGVGYSIILNDMHGKPLETWTHGGVLEIDDVGNLSMTDNALKANKISGQKYFFKTDRAGNLDNMVKAVNDQGEVNNITLGVESEMTLDYREHKTAVNRVSISGNLDTWIIPILIPITIPIPAFWPKYSYSKTQFRGATATKVINKHAILDKVEVHSNGSVITTKNEIYDEHTGEVLITSVNNEFEENGELENLDNLIYSMKYPAHWAYSGMEQAAQNIGAEIQLSTTNSGFTSLVVDGIYEDDIFHEGDELIILRSDDFAPNPEMKLWVSQATLNGIVLIDDNGDTFTTGSVVGNQSTLPVAYTVKIIRSGHRNQQSLPIASLTSLKDPTVAVFNGDDSDLEVLDFSAQEFDEYWQTYCRTGQYIGHEDCLYDVTIIDPKTNEMESARVFTEDDDCNYYKEVEVVLNPELPSECEEMSELAVFECQLDMDVTYWLKIGNAAGNEGFFVDAIKMAVANSGNVSYLDVPLNEAAGAVLEGLVTVDPEDLLFQYGSEDIFEEAISGVIKNYLFENEYITDELYNIDLNVSSLYDVLTLVFSFKCKNNPQTDWVGLDRSMNTLTFDDDSFQNWGIQLTHDGTPSFRPHCSDMSIAEFDCGAIVDLIASETEDGIIEAECNFNKIAVVSTPITHIVTSDPTQVNCPREVILDCALEDDNINPYLHGIKGNWRPVKSWVHNNVPRVHSDPSGDYDESKLANYGYYSDFNQFWKKPITPGGKWNPFIEHYTLTNEITRYNTYGEALENKDALDNYSAAILGYNNKLAIASGNNTKYRNFTFDGFEEYDFYTNQGECINQLHLDLLPDQNLSNDEAHTGFYSLEVSKQFVRKVEIPCSDIIEAKDGGTPGVYYDECEHCLPGFSPEFEYGKDNKYVVDLWIKGNGSLSISQYDQNAFLATDQFVPAEISPTIEGWQRIYGFFTLREGCDELRLIFDKDKEARTAFFDDFRIYPFDANMMSYVYYPNSLKLMAELDENNHATLYEYDEEWNLIRVKKETERGIYTIQENRSNLRIN